MLKRFKKTMYPSSSAFGILSVLFLFANHFYPDKFTIDLLRLLMYLVFILGIFGAIVFKEHVSQKSLWIRRGIMMGLSCLVIILLEYLFHFIPPKPIIFHTPKVIQLESLFHIDPAQQIWGFTGMILICDIVLTTIAYIIADQIEKKNLQRINEKLKQMNNE